SAIWEYDGIVNKTIGDAVMAVFNFPIRRDNHAQRAVRAARDLQKGWNSKRESLAEAANLSSQELGVGVGINTGELSFGEFGRSHRDLTAIGTVVNLAARAQSVANAGKILVTQAVYERSQLDLMGSQGEEYQLKGFEAPIKLYAI